MEKKQETKLITLMQAVALVIGVVIGSGVFFKPAKVFAAAGAPGLGILAWIMGGVITIAAALSIAELASAIPKTGGMFTYLRELYGESVAFLLGWVQTLVYYPGTLAALCIVFATQATVFVPMGDMTQKFLAIAVAIFLTGVNIISTTLTAKLNVVFTIAKLIPIFAIVIFGLISGTVHDYSPMVSEASTAAGFGAAILGTLWAYEGWVNVCNIGGELENPTKNLPKAIVIGLAVVMTAYVAINVAIINVMPMAAVAASPKAASDAAVILFGPAGAAFISAGIMVSIFGASNGFAMTGARVPFAMAKDDLLPFKTFFIKEASSGTPINALIFQCILSILYIFSGSFDILTNLVVFTLWIFFVLAVFGVFVLRSKHKDLIKEGQYKVPLFPVVPIIGIVGGAYILISTLMTDTMNALIGVGVALVGIPVYMFVKKQRNK
ncbi:MAG: amino acid permease [Firmicutes bacterium]|nr:amino acid permease [Bacillota bacterium]